MEEDEDQLMQNTNIRCNICGESNFNVREGFYYCLECGTKQEQVRAIEVDQEDMFNENQHAIKQTIKKDTKDENELTSWECYNYILRGMVEDLLNMGAGEHLKLYAFQVWAAILSRNEVAFFSKKEPRLPRMSVRYYSRDARTIYNHKIKKIKRSRRRSKNVVAEGDEEKNAKRVFKKSKRKLDESAYSIKSNETNESNYSVATVNNAGGTSQKSSTAPLRLTYSVAARKTFKKFMPLKHLSKHEIDDTGSLKCHKLRLNSRKTHKFIHTTTTMSIKKVYAILGIALNLIGDDIQLSDLVRFINEEHITTRNVLNYLPENMRSSGSQLLKEINFSDFPDKYSTQVLREQICYIARAIPILGFEMPDLFALSRRYVEDLNLPPDFADYIERLMNVLPPQMRTRTPHQYPQYEARAMAYILFTAKLLFGLDGEKELLISESAKAINKELHDIQATKLTESNQPALFVWTDWVEYVEMRKVIVARYNSTYCRQFNEILTTDQVVHELQDKERRQKESEHNHRQTQNKNLKKVQDNVRHIFEGLLKDKWDTDEENSAPYVQFQPSLLPSHNYFRRVLMLNESGVKTLIPIPKMMHVDHTKRSLMPFLDSTDLSAYLAPHGFNLTVEELACTANRKNMGIFHYGRNCKLYPDTKVFKANTDISKEDWLKEVKKKTWTGELVFKTEMEEYNRTYKRKLDKEREMKRAHMDDSLNYLSSLLERLKIRKSLDSEKILEMSMSDLRLKATYEVFNEDNMEPLDIELIAPQNLLKTPKEEKEENDDINIELEASIDGRNELILKRSNFDYWSLLGYIGPMNVECKKELFGVFPPTFSWLMELCAQMIGGDWIDVFEQLLILELMFTYGIENLDDIDKCLHFTYNHPIKDINVLIKHYRELW